MTKYCLGFAFDNDLRRVALIRKNRPAWQAGCLNGIGGKINEQEEPLTAMVREFSEETGLKTQPENWTYYGRLHGENFDCALFVTRLTGEELAKLESKTDEIVGVFLVERLLCHRTISNIMWLIHSAIDYLKTPFVISTRYL